MNILATLRCDLTSLTSVPCIPLWTWTSWRPFVVVLPVWHLSPLYPLDMNILATLRCDLTSLAYVPFIPLWTWTSLRPFVVVLPVWHLSPVYPSGHEHLGDPSLWSYQFGICPLYTPLDMNISATLRCDLTSLTSVPFIPLWTWTSWRPFVVILPVWHLSPLYPSGHEHLGDPSLWSYQFGICPLYTPPDMNILPVWHLSPLYPSGHEHFGAPSLWSYQSDICPLYTPLDMNISATLCCDLTSRTSVPFIPLWTWTYWRPFVVILPVWHLSPLYPSGHEHLGDPSLWSHQPSFWHFRWHTAVGRYHDNQTWVGICFVYFNF